MKIEYYKKQIYGLDKFYIKDTRTAVLITSLTGTITVSTMDLAILKALGHEVIEVSQEETELPELTI